MGAIDKKSMTFEAFLHEQEEDEEPIFTDVILVSGETYDVAVDIEHANPIDLKCIMVHQPANGSFVIRNRGDYEVKYV